MVSKETLEEIARVGREWPDGIHTCAELQRLEPGRRPCTCGRCTPEPLKLDGCTCTPVRGSHHPGCPWSVSR